MKDLKLFLEGKTIEEVTVKDVKTKKKVDVVYYCYDKESLDKEYSSAKNLIQEKKIQYIYSLDDEVLTEAQEKYISDNGLVKVSINNLHTLTDDERKNNETYLSLMKDIIEEYKRELYKS